MQLRYLLHTTILCGLALAPGVALANPVGGSVAGGSAAISSSGSTLTVNQTSSRAIIDWNSFDISSGETTKFVQPSSSAIALNRISENKPSQIDGQLTANGNIILVNPNGVVFGAGSQVNVNGLVVTSADVDNSSFMNGGKLAFSTPGNANAQIIAKGQITVADAGLVGLVAPYVENEGVITARLGKVQLASGDSFTLDMAGDGITQVTVTGALAQQLARNSGAILADGGTIQLTAAAAADIVNALVVNTGELKADAFAQQGGSIILSASNGTATNSGTIYARGLNSGESGGNVTIAANHVQQQGTIDASGQDNGGSVSINFAQEYTDTPTSTITANGIAGSGGSINLIGSAGTGSTLTASGTYDATSQYGKGGIIGLFADAINLTGARLDASGATGGQITVGAPTSQSVAIDSATTLKADGTQAAGGSITVQGTTVAVSGTASAQGTTGGSIHITFDNSYVDTADAMLTVAGSQGSGGAISVTGGTNASLTASGSYIADGNTDGGTIAMLTQEGNILLLGAYLSSRGPLGGGTIKIGGDFEGADGTEKARYTTVDKNTLILADATGDGNGGKVAVWSDDYTQFYGMISAEGGANGGNGGYVETSGKQILTMNGTVSASAPKGQAGTWLMDPADVTITTADSGITGNPNFVPDGTQAEATINVTDITTALNAGTNVTVTTGGDALAGTNNGQITVSSAITATGTGSLTLSAYSNIVVNAAITLAGGNLILDADNHANGSGYIEIVGNIATNGGNITMGGGESNPANITAGTGFATGNAEQAIGVLINESDVNAGGGNIIINGEGYNSTGNNNYGINVTWYNGHGSITTTGNGTINLSGIGQGTGNSDEDYAVASDGIISTVNGNLTITGTGGGAGSGFDNFGFYVLSGGAIETTGSGNISITGTGGTGGYGNIGIYVTSTGSTIETTGSGNISITGTGGTSSGGSNDGIFTDTANAIQATGTGTITLTGTGGTGGGGGEHGILINSGSVTGNGGAMSIIGTGGNDSGNVNVGVYVIGTISNTGALTIAGTGGNSSGNSNYGVCVHGGTISNSGSGTLTVTAIAAGSATNNWAALVDSSGVISTVNGNLTITGSGSEGISVRNSGSVIKTTGSGNISIAGNDSTNSGYGDWGVDLETSGSIQATGSGAIAVTGNGSGNGNGWNGGVWVATGASIVGNGGNMTITGTAGSNGGNSNQGIAVYGGTISNDGSGTLTLNGTGGGNANSGSDYGVYISGNNSVVQSTGSGAVSITGYGGNTTGNNNIGVYSDKTSGSSVSINNGNADIDGTGNGAWDIYLPQLTTSGTGTFSLTGNGTGAYNGVAFGASSTYDYYSWLNTFHHNTAANLEILSSISKTIGSDTTFTLSAPESIILGSNATITSTSGKLNVIFDSDTGGSDGGILLNPGSSITTNGGDITMGGGATPATTAAVGTATYNGGVNIDGATLSAGGGNITLTGMSYGGNGSAWDGIDIQAGASVSTSGSGAITLTGQGSSGNAGTNDVAGVWIYNSSVSAVNGAITIAGTGEGTNSSSFAVGEYGVGIVAGTSITTSGTGNISITGTGAAVGDSNGQNHGVFFNSGNSTVASAGGGTVTITGIAGGGAGSYGIDSYSGAVFTIGGASDTDAITLIADSLSFSTAPTIETTGTVTFKPYTSGTTIGVAGGSGTLQISSSLLNAITAGGIVIGTTSDTGAMDVDAHSWNAPVSLYNGSAGIILDGTQTMGGNSFLADTTGNITLGRGGTISSNAAGNAIVLVAESGTLINDSGSNAPLITPNGRFIGYSSQRPSGDNPITYQQEIISYTYSTLPPSSIASPRYSATENTWVYAAVPPSTLPPAIVVSSSSSSSGSTSSSSSAASTDSGSGGTSTTSSSPSSAGTSSSSSGSPGESSGSSSSSTTTSSSASSSVASSTSSSGTSSSSAPSSSSPSGISSSQSSGNANTVSPALSGKSDLNSHIDDIALADAAGNEAIDSRYDAHVTAPNAHASASDDHPIAAPSSFKYLDDQLNKMDNVLDEQEDESADAATKPINTITKATKKIMKQLVIPGVASVGAASVGYVLLFGRTVYSALAMFLGLGLGSQRLDPATLLEFWERESWKRDDHDKKVESMFGDRKAAVPARFRRP